MAELGSCPFGGCTICRDGASMRVDGQEVLHFGVSEGGNMHVVTVNGHTVYMQTWISSTPDSDFEDELENIAEALADEPVLQVDAPVLPVEARAGIIDALTMGCYAPAKKL